VGLVDSRVMPPLVSVILPTHNRRRTLSRAVDSVLSQTHGDLELIVVDDGSTDTTAELIAEYDDPRLTFEALARQAGAATARNRGIELARGQLIAFQDSDDEWVPGKLESQLEVFDRDARIGWVGGRHRVVAGSEAWTVGPTSIIAGEDHRAELLDGRAFVTPTWLVRREVLAAAGGFRQDMPCLEDWDLIFRLDDLCEFAAVDEVILTRYASADSLFGNADRQRIGLELILADHAGRWRDHPAALADRHRDLARLQSRLGQRRQALRSYATAASLQPLRGRTYGAMVKALLAPTSSEE